MTKTKKEKSQTASVAPTTGAVGGRIVLVGTYKGGQLEKWRGWYCWPLDKKKPAAKNAKTAKKARAQSAKDNTDSSEAQRKTLSSVSELWLFQGTKAQKTFKAEFVGIKTRGELVRDYGYPAKGKAHGTNYALFKTKLLYGPGGDTPGEADAVIVRTKDFATSPKVRKQLKEYLESPDRKNPTLAKLLPSVITSLPPERLRVCEAAVQLSFFGVLLPEAVMPYAKPQNESYRVVSLFAGCGGLDLGFVGGFDFLGRHFKRNPFDIVWANELNPNACKTYERNFGAHIVCGDIKDQIDGMPTDADVIMGGFPCQDISINGKMQGIKGKRSSLYAYIVEAVRRCRPKVFLAENVGSLMLKQNEYSFSKILEDFGALDYNVTCRDAA